MKCMIRERRREVTFLTNCYDLVKMVSSRAEWPTFSTHLKEIEYDRGVFSSFALLLIPRRANVNADKLAHNVRVLPRYISYVNNVPSSLF